MVRTLAPLTLAASLALAAVAGCGKAPAPPATSEAASAAKQPAPGPDGEHAHKPGTHGGIIAEIGRDNYHAEAVFEKGGTLRLYTLGQDEARVQEVEAQTLTAYARAEGGTESAPFTLNPEPQPGDAQGMTSQFVGRLPAELRGRRVEVTVPSIRIAGERFRLGFASAGGDGHDEDMPAKVTDEEERLLYLTPGGKYTREDIAANGNMTASQKFQGLKSAHNARTRPGDRTCPVSETKANPKFTWVVGGKEYEFCCPPCVDEFVKMAKEHPEQVKDPGAYVRP
jgi:hypothetical protein